ncbi:Glyco_18 domain containing protein [Dermatophagoides farinae]|uniref:Glyco_18 domain containing protein n=1 Tax=Dermatophagoides farinae TaxID=6954 RepID=A0A922HVG2_DERFA|nr:Glyco_18 domain containing protein [Dermatophagoides farinae]
MIIITILLLFINSISNVQANSSTFQLLPQDVAKHIDVDNSYSTSSSSSSSTTAKDIRKLLEDYVQYLASLPDIRKEIREKNHSQKSQHDIISTAETNDDEKAIHHPRLTAYRTLVPIINHPSSQGEYVYHHHHHHHVEDDNNDERRRLRNNFDETNVSTTKQKSKQSSSSSSTIQPRRKSDQNSIIVAGNGYGESGVSLSLNNEELNSFIHTVLGTKKDRPTTTTTTTTATITTTTELPSSMVDGDSDDEQLSNMTINNDVTYNNDLAIEELMAYVDPDDDDDNDGDDDDDNNNNDDDDDDKIEHRRNNSTKYSNETSTIETSTLQPLMITTTIDPFSSSKMITTTANKSSNNNDQVSGEISVTDLHNNIVNGDHESSTMTTIANLIIENQINSTKIAAASASADDDDDRHSNRQQSIEKQPQMLLEINQNDLLEQLKRTRELLSIQIEKLKTLEKTVFRRRKTVPTESINDTTTATTTTTTAAVSQSMITTESPFDMTTESSSNFNHQNNNQIDQSSRINNNKSNIFDKSFLNNETFNEMSTMTSAPEYSSSSSSSSLSSSSPYIELITLNINKNITATSAAAAAATATTTIQPFDENDDGSYYETTTTTTMATTAIPTFKHNEKSFHMNLIKENSNKNDDDDDDDEIIYSRNFPSKSIQLNYNGKSSNNKDVDDNGNGNSDDDDDDYGRIDSNLKIIKLNDTTINNNDKSKSSSTIIPMKMSTTTKTSSKTAILMPIIIEQNNDKNIRLLSNNHNNNNVSESIMPIINSSSSSSSTTPSPSSLFAIDEPNSVLILSHSSSGSASTAEPINKNYNVNNNENETVNKNNNNNNNNIKNESNIETMILTHVPKITIIHKIMKPYRNANNGGSSSSSSSRLTKIDKQNIKDQSIDNNNNNHLTNKQQREYLFESSDENIYQEALRRHQDLIRSTMSSMSLYPASIKRYRIRNGTGNNSRINNVGEMYLLPNFSNNGSRQQTNISIAKSINHHQSSPLIHQVVVPTIVPTLSLDDDNNNNNSNNNTFGSASEYSEILIGSSSSDQTNNNVGKNNEKTDMNKNQQQQQQSQIENNNNNDNNNHIMIPRNKFNNNHNVFELEINDHDHDHDHQQQHPRISRIRNGKNQSKKKRTKLLLNYQTIMAINRNPENLLRLYRPRFKNRKRFRKIRLPNGYRSMRKDNNNTDFSIDNRPLSTITEDNVITTTTSPPTTTTTPSLSIDDDISDSFIKEVENNEILRQTTTTIMPEIESMNLINRTNDISDDSGISITTTTTTTTMEPPTTEFIIENKREKINNSTATINIVPANVLINSTINNRLMMNQTNNFKIFCTYDAYRSIPFADYDNDGDNNSDKNKNNDKGRYFDIDQLEKNSMFLKYCTHLIYAFANIDLNGELYTGLNAIQQDSERNREYNQECLLRLQKLKRNNPHLKLLVAVGGWDTPPQLFSLMVATGKLRDHLSTNIYKFVHENGFDGAIIAWFYPVYGSKSSMDSRSTRATYSSHSMFQFDDKQNLIKFVRSMRKKFDSIRRRNQPHRLELGLMVPPFQEFIDRGYDAKKLAESVDHLILMTYDYYGSWENHVHHFSPLYAQNNNTFDERNSKFNINYTVNYWINGKQAPRNQTMIGVAFYGRSFTLANQLNAKIGSLSIGPGLAGPITNRPGLLSFNELCELYLGNQNVRLSEDEYRITANLQLHDQWVGFDDELSLYLKTKYALGNHLSGIFIWSINYDDYRNRCGWGQFPLLKAVNKAVEHCTLWKQCSPYIIRNSNSQIAQNSSSSSSSSSLALTTTRRRKR